jgi:hypothetical protein
MPPPTQRSMAHRSIARRPERRPAQTMLPFDIDAPTSAVPLVAVF